MSDANRMQLAYVAETIWGETPSSPTMTKLRVLSESLDVGQRYTRSNEIRDDRMTDALIKVAQETGGGLDFELSWGAFDPFIAAALFSTWQNQPEISGGDVSQVTASSDTLTVASGGASYKDGHLVRLTGFGESANSGVFEVASSTATTVVLTSSSGVVDESSPPSTARIKVVGFAGTSGDIVADASGLTSTALDFTTLGLTAGQWIKIGGGTAGTGFATTANNGWARVSSIAANDLDLDDLPTGWTADAGSGKTIRVWVGDYVRVGTTRTSFTLEKGALAQATPTYISYRGMVPNSLALTLDAGAMVRGSLGFQGKDGSLSTTALDASPDDAVSYAPFNAVANVGRLAIDGVAAGAPSYVRSLAVSVGNNLRGHNAVGTLGRADVRAGDADVSGRLSAYFGDKTLYETYLNGTESRLDCRLERDGRALVVTLPRVRFETGSVQARGRNQDVMAELGFRALKDATMATSVQMDRLEYVV